MNGRNPWLAFGAGLFIGLLATVVLHQLFAIDTILKEETLQAMLFILLGALVGFGSNYLLENYRNKIALRNKKHRTKEIINSLKIEIEEGINRCRSLVRLLEDEPPKFSFSRLFVDLWKASRTEIIQHLDNQKIIRLLHKIYYRFDLVNFNMERGEFGIGAAFAQSHLQEMEDNYGLLCEKIDSIRLS